MGTNKRFTDLEMAKVIIRAFSLVITRQFKPDDAFTSAFQYEILRATGGCSIKTSIVLDLLREVGEELKAEARGLAVQNVKPTDWEQDKAETTRLKSKDISLSDYAYKGDNGRWWG